MANEIRGVQNKILEIMKYIDRLCRENGIVYYIMGGTALGAVRHGGFIPWDDDLDIFMTPSEYDKFLIAFQKDESDKFFIQEWRSVPRYLEYAKVRMNGTTFIEEVFKERKNMHHGIYVDIMILHKVSSVKLMQKFTYVCSKFVTLYGLSQRNWIPKNRTQELVLKSLKYMPCELMANIAYWQIYRYDKKQKNYKYCYWITPAKFKAGLFDKSFFSDVVDIPFEDTVLFGSFKIKEYLVYRYGDYMKLPSKDEQEQAVHAMICDIDKDYTEYM